MSEPNETVIAALREVAAASAVARQAMGRAEEGILGWMPLVENFDLGGMSGFGPAEFEKVQKTDRDELRRVVEFIRAGGLEKSRSEEKEDLEEQRRALKADQMREALRPRDVNAAGFGLPDQRSDLESALSLLGGALRDLWRS